MNYNPRTKAIKTIRADLLGARVPFTGEIHDKTVGMLGEKQLRILENNARPADILDGRHQPIELKLHKQHSTTLQTLFTKNPLNVIRSLIDQFGYEDFERDRRAFYHTFQNGKDPYFQLVFAKDQFELVRKDGAPLIDGTGKEFRLNWSKKDLRAVFAAKLERLFSGAGQAVEYGDRQAFQYRDFGIYFEGFKTRAFWQLLKQGVVAIDFRCHMDAEGKVRDHGIAFRIPRDSMHRLYEYNEVIRK